MPLLLVLPDSEQFEKFNYGINDLAGLLDTADLAAARSVELEPGDEHWFFLVAFFRPSAGGAVRARVKLDNGQLYYQMTVGAGLIPAVGIGKLTNLP